MVYMVYGLRRNRRGIVHWSFRKQIELIRVIRRDDGFRNPPFSSPWEHHEVTRLGCARDFSQTRIDCKRCVLFHCGISSKGFAKAG